MNAPIIVSMAGTTRHRGLLVVSHLTSTSMNCLLYARVSTDKQAQKELSIPAQLQIMTEHACKNGWKVVGRYVDRGESARTANRPELKRLLQHCRENDDIDVVLVHKLDRLARNVLDHVTIKLTLNRRKIRLVSVAEPLADNAMGEFMECIIAGYAQFYSANLGSEIRKSNMAKLQKGEWPHKPPVGYKSVKGVSTRIEHQPDETAAPLVKQAFELFSTGNYSLKSLSEEMFHRGLTTRYGKMYSEENTKRILSRDFYIGRITWQGKAYPGKHEPIVPKDLFYRVQEVLKNRSIDTGEKGRLEFLLRGIAYCRVCNRRLTGEIHPRGSYYRCLHDLHRPKCGEPYIPVKLLDGQLESLYERLQPPKEFIELLQAEMHEIARQRKQTAAREVGTLKRAIAETEKKELRLLDEMLAERVPRDTYEKMEKAYREQREHAEARLCQLEVDYGDPLAFLDKCAAVAGMLAYLHRRFTFEQRKNLVRAVFCRIDVQDRDIVGVEFNPPFSFFFGDTTRTLFKDHPVAGTKQDILEQIVHFTISSEYTQAKELVDRLTLAATQHVAGVTQVL